MPPRQTYSIPQIKDMLIDRVEDVVAAYVPAASGSYRAHGKYYTLNPGRADRSVGSFWVQMTGPEAGRWMDHAVSGGFGDILDLIALACHTDTTGAIKEARAFLGLETMDPAERRRREARAAELARQREAKSREDADRHERVRRRAVQLWLSGSDAIRATPVDHYLAGRGIDLSQLGRAPGAIRFLPALTYYHEDRTTGEVYDQALPAMGAAVRDGKGRQIALHRTYLAPTPTGWGKASVPADWPFEAETWNAKKVLGRYRGGWITIWNGGPGPKGGKPLSVDHAPEGSEVFVTEGIEDGLSVACLLPEARVIAAISLSNLAPLDLPPNVGRITIVADQDEGQEARDALDRAIEAHQRAGRDVRLWKNRHGGKDLNDALKEARGERKGQQNEPETDTKGELRPASGARA